jgi:hypothetical protein
LSIPSQFAPDAHRHSQEEPQQSGRDIGKIRAALLLVAVPLSLGLTKMHPLSFPPEILLNRTPPQLYDTNGHTFLLSLPFDTRKALSNAFGYQTLKMEKVKCTRPQRMATRGDDNVNGKWVVLSIKGRESAGGRMQDDVEISKQS